MNLLTAGPSHSQSEPGPSLLGVLARMTFVLALGVAAGLAFLFAAFAALALGLIVMGAALALQFAPRPKYARSASDLEARRTASGWVIELGGPRRS